MRNGIARAVVGLASTLVLVLSGCAGPDVPTPPAQPPGFDLELVRGGFTQPIFVTHAGDGTGALFVVEQRGLVLELAQDGAPPYLDVRDRVLSGGERGLLGLAFHPEFERNGRLFLHYTDKDADTTLSEFRRAADGRPDPASERILLTVEDPYPNHNGGMVAFGPDGMLYVAIGDGGSANDPQNRAQGLDNLMGKILRIDIDAQTEEVPYGIPDDNPFADRSAGGEIWAYGLRNPWRFSFDRGGPDGEGRGDLWIADVGQGAYEEVNHEPAGGDGGVNYGWSRFEGRHIQIADREAPGAIGPVAEYDHDGGHCSVTGGYVYRGSAVPALRGTYVLADYCTGVVWTVHPDGDGDYPIHQVMDTTLSISSFGEDEAGEVYVVDHGGEIHRIVAKR